jgi:phospholipid transport system substrate-binding protein
MRWGRVVGRVIAVVVAVLCLPLAGWAAPTDDIRDTIEQVIKILADPALKSAEKTKERRAAIRQVVGHRFNFEEMARRSLATHWRDRTAAEQEEFVRIFTDLMEYSYIDKMERLSTEKIEYASEMLDGDQATVRTRLVTRKDVYFPIDYKLSNATGRWEVYDVAIEGISLINEYRTQFNKIIRTKSYDELVRLMRAKRVSQDLETREVSSR